MGIMDKIRKLGGGDDDYEKELEALEKEELNAVNFEQQENSGYVGRNIVDFNPAGAGLDRENAVARGNIVKSKITTIKPKDFNDVQTIANCLRDKIPVVINFEGTETEEAKRILDFISGTIYAINGAVKKVSQEVFICAPDNVTVTYTDDEKKSNFLD